MFCNNCGKPLTEGAAFCEACGTPVAATPVEAAVEAPKKKKKKTGLIIGIIAGVTAFAIALGCVGGWFLLGNKETVYVCTEKSLYSENGVKYSVTTYEYDKHGRLLSKETDKGADNEIWDENLGVYVYNPSEPDGVLDSYYYYEYNDQGDMISSEECYSADPNKETQPWEYEWEYEDDQAVSLRGQWQSGDLQSKLNYEFEYEDGNLVAAYSVHREADTKSVFMLAEYDDEGRLEKEAFISLEQTKIFEYEYDKKDRVTQVTYCTAHGAGYVNNDMDPFEEANVQAVTEFTYDKKGKLIEVKREDAVGYEEYHAEYQYEGKKLVEIDSSEDVEFTYKGNKLVKAERDDKEYNFDKHGNLIEIEYENGSSIKYEYKKLRLSKADAQAYYRWLMRENRMGPEGARQSFSWIHDLMPTPLCPELKANPLYSILY